MFVDKFNKMLGVSDSRDAPNKLMKILYSKEKREAMFDELMKVKKYLDHDWFHEYFQEEHAQRKKHKQDFTPKQVCEITNRIVQPKQGNTYHESTAGSGGMAIEHWNYNKSGFYYLEELSDRAIPFLLFNTLIRGMNAVVIHGDSLNRTAKGVFFIQNNGKYSNLNLMPYTESIENEFGIKFTDYFYKDIKEDYDDNLAQMIWEERFDEVFNRVISQQTYKIIRTSKYINQTVKEVLKDYDNATIIDEKILGIYPGGLDERLLDRQIKEVVEIRGIKALARIRI